MNTIKNDAAMARGIGMPRRSRTIFDSRTGARRAAPSGEPDEDAGLVGPGMGPAGPRDRAATAVPSAKGTMTAKATQTARMSELGIHAGKGAKGRGVPATPGH